MNPSDALHDATGDESPTYEELPLVEGWAFSKKWTPPPGSNCMEYAETTLSVFQALTQDVARKKKKVTDFLHVLNHLKNNN